MAAFQLFDHTVRKLMAGEFAAADTYKLILLDGSAAFDSTHTTKAEVVSTFEVSGNGWTAGGETLSGVVVSTILTNGAMFDATDVVKAISGGDLDPYKAMVIVDDTDTGDPPLVYLQLSAEVTVPSGYSVIVRFPENGIITGTVPAA